VKAPERRARAARTLKSKNDEAAAARSLKTKNGAPAAARAFKTKTDEPATVLVGLRIEEERWGRRVDVSFE